MAYYVEINSGEFIQMELDEVATLNGIKYRLDDVRAARSKYEEGGTAFVMNLTTGKSLLASISTKTPVINDVRRELAKLRGRMTQGEVAEKSKLAVTTISRVENMTQSITTDKLERWLNAIGYTLKIEKL